MYTAGAMKNVDPKAAMAWRKELNQLLYHTNFIVIAPNTLYNYDVQFHTSEKEVKDIELSAVAGCDIVVVNLEGIESSVGTLFELANAEAKFKATGKPIILGFGNKTDLHPWIEQAISRIDPDVQSTAQYIKRLYETGIC